MFRIYKFSVMWLCAIGRQGPDISGDCDIVRDKLPKKDVSKHWNYSWWQSFTSQKSLSSSPLWEPQILHVLS